MEKFWKTLTFNSETICVMTPFVTYFCFSGFFPTYVIVLMTLYIRIYVYIYIYKNIGVGCHVLLQAIFLIQGSNPSLLHWQVDSLPLTHQGSREEVIRTP